MKKVVLESPCLLTIPVHTLGHRSSVQLNMYTTEALYMLLSPNLRNHISGGLKDTLDKSCA